jgi:hypothetical protein
MRTITSSLPGIVFIAACVAPGTRPHDMAATQHEAMARGENQSAAAHVAQYDPSAMAERRRCGSSREIDVCWSSVFNPMATHLREADEHRKLAAQHRAASQALRDAEARACTGLSERDRDMSPFVHREEIARVEPLFTGAASPKSAAQTRGATIFFRAAPGLTAPWLQRVVDCHIARNAALGHDAREMPYCPLVPKDVTARVTERGAELAVEVSSSDPAVAQEIVRRAQALAAR